MDYKEKYKQGLECIQEILSGAGDSIKTSILRKRLQPFFPELKENKSERVRKGLIKTISSLLDNTILYHTDITKEEALAWLEKQGEKKPAEDAKLLDADRMIAWLVANICDFEYYVKLFKKDFGL